MDLKAIEKNGETEHAASKGSVVESIAAAFAIAGDLVGYGEIDSGHINTTYLVTFRDGARESRYILQRINEQVFKEPLMVVENVCYVTKHINHKVLLHTDDMGGQTLNMYPSRDGKFYVEGEGGGVWRCYNFIEGCKTYDIVESTRQAYQAAHAFGAFQDLVADLDAGQLTETIPHFHNTQKRFEALERAAERDAHGRLSEIQAEYLFVLERKDCCGELLRLQQEGVLPTRVTHNDTKLNNVMMDEATDQAVCVIDLDTVMPGLSVYDFGDLVRTATSPAAEDERDLSMVDMRMPYFEALAEGYIDGCAALTQVEMDYMVTGAKIITLETGIRFLTDYLEGDQYFKIERAGQNLDRARTQLKLVEKIEAQEEVMRNVVQKLASARS
ncbi:phosphotransferase enzyme family protein [Rubritalea marina]|uniref:phosphotransferase enzyme family protein n=1 Tax=Rubritalea marina TaxID=361055 RepID=UPI00037025D6|nr:aminoglycoside phosphotransferase family protein [Rubritalea marina]